MLPITRSFRLPNIAPIGARPFVEGPTDPIAGMLECHDRIRQFLDGLGRLAALDDLRDPRAPDAARACARYFREGLPLHGLDEDLSLAPRLRPTADAEVIDALDAMAAEHGLMDRGLPQLLADLDAVGVGDPPAVEELRAGHLWLDRLLRAHIEMEERVIFPAAADLDAETLAMIAGEMRARRR